MQPMLLKKANGLLLVKASGYQTHQRRIQGICSAVMTGPFVLQVLSMKGDKVSSTVTAGL